MLREWVTEDRIEEAARLIVPEEAVEDACDAMRHIVRRSLHDPECFVPPESWTVPVSVFGTNHNSGVLPVCLVCRAYFTQVMPASLAQDFCLSHVQQEHPNEWQLWRCDFPWSPDDPIWN